MAASGVTLKTDSEREPGGRAARFDAVGGGGVGSLKTDLIKEYQSYARKLVTVISGGVFG